MICKECGISHNTNNEYFCPKCLEKVEMRNDFRNLMNQLQKIISLEYPEDSFMRGFSYAEMERFSLVFIKLQKKYHFPIDLKDFVNSPAKKVAKKLINH